MELRAAHVRERDAAALEAQVKAQEARSEAKPASTIVLPAPS